jgi:hypothetical protein
MLQSVILGRNLLHACCQLSFLGLDLFQSGRKLRLTSCDCLGLRRQELKLATELTQFFSLPPQFCVPRMNVPLSVQELCLKLLDYTASPTATFSIRGHWTHQAPSTSSTCGRCGACFGCRSTFTTATLRVELVVFNVFAIRRAAPATGMTPLGAPSPLRLPGSSHGIPNTCKLSACTLFAFFSCPQRLLAPGKLPSCRFQGGQ